MRARFVFAGAATILLGCAGILGVPDLTYDPTATAGNPDASSTGPDGSAVGDAGGDAAPICAPGTDFQTDKKNCGRCGHDCAGGDCNAGTCQPFQLAAINQAPLEHMALSDTFVFVSTAISLTTQVGGVWRIPKGGGAAELYANVRYATGLGVIGNDLYFVSNDDKYDDAGKTGGLYRCPVTGNAPCSPQLLYATDSPLAVAVDNGKVYFGDQPSAGGANVRSFAPPSGPVQTFRADGTVSNSLVVRGDRTWSTYTLFQQSPQSAKLAENLPDGGYPWLTQYDAPHAADGRIVGIPGGLLFTAYDEQTETGGVVRRVPIDSSVSPCDYGGTTLKRPYGVYADATRVFWTNQGDGNATPYTNPSVVSCPLAGCCTKPDVTIWTGPSGDPTDIVGDDAAIYWVNYDNGQVWKSAKP